MKPENHGAFEKSCHALIKAECQREPELRRQLKKTWSIGKIAKAIGVTLFCAVAAFHLLRFPFRACIDDARIVCLFGAMLATIWSVFFISSRCAHSRTAAAVSLPLLYTPFSRGDYNAAMRKTLSKPPWFFCLGLLVILFATALKCGVLGWLNIVFMCGLTLLCAMACWAVALWMACHPLSRSLAIASTVVYIGSPLILLVFLCAKKGGFTAFLCRQLERYGEAFALLTPGGWTVGVFSAHIGALSQNAWVALTALAGLALSMPFAFRSVERYWSYDKFLEMDWLGAPDSCEEEDAEPAREDIPATLDINMAEVQQHWAPVLETSRVGGFERWFLRHLSSEDKTILERASLKFPNWTLRALHGLWTTAAMIALFIPLESMGFDTSTSVARIGMVIVLIHLLFVTFPAATGLSSTVTFWTAYPFDVSRHFKIHAKAARWRCCAVAPLYLAAGGVIGYATGDIAYGVLLAVKIMLIAVLGIPHIPFFTNASVHLHGFFSSVLRIAFLVGMLVVLAVACFISFVNSIPPPISFLGVLLFIAACRVWQWHFLREYDRGRVM